MSGVAGLGLISLGLLSLVVVVAVVVVVVRRRRELRHGPHDRP
ncbi:hypothetical protein [Salsipaludibacter albus]|nr:hypothetical protein [Salsipaludibacter albus]